MEKELIRIGKVSEIDRASGMVSVVYHDKDDSVTAMLPMLSGKYDMPEVGDQVLVLHLSNGTEAGLVLGRFYSDNNKPKESTPGLIRLELSRDGTCYIKCNGGTITIAGAQVIFTGSLNVQGNLTVTGKLTAESIETGPITSGAIQAEAINASSVTASGDVVAGGISLRSHTHTDSMSGSTSAPH